MALKFEDKVKIGEHIRAFDFKPMRGREDCFMEGQVREVIMHNAAKVFVVMCTRDVWRGNEIPVSQNSRVGNTVYVPVETSDDYDHRVFVV